MARQAQRLDDHDVESQCERRQFRAHREERFDGAGDATPLAWPQRGGARREIRPRLDLDRRQDTPAPRDDVDFASRAAPVAGEDAPAAQPQMPSAQPLGEPAAPPAFTRRGSAAVRASSCGSVRALPRQRAIVERTAS